MIPFIFIAIGISKLMDSGSLEFLADYWFMTLWTLGFSIGAGYLMRSFLRPNVFDKSINRFYKGFFSYKTKDAKNNIKLSRVVALQIIGEVVRGEKSKYNSFELNLVLDDANRINVVDHGNLKGIIADTETLSDFLNLPIWTAEKVD